MTSSPHSIQELRLWSQRTWVEILTVTYACVISGGKILILTQFPHLKNEDVSLSNNCCEHWGNMHDALRTQPDLFLKSNFETITGILFKQLLVSLSFPRHQPPSKLLFQYLLNTRTICSTVWSLTNPGDKTLLELWDFKFLHVTKHTESVMTKAL